MEGTSGSTTRICIINGQRYAIPAELTLVEIAARAAGLNPDLVNALVTEAEDGTVTIQRRPAPGEGKAVAVTSAAMTTGDSQ